VCVCVCERGSYLIHLVSVWYVDSFHSRPDTPPIYRLLSRLLHSWVSCLHNAVSLFAVHSRVSLAFCGRVSKVFSHVQPMTKILVGWSLRRDTPVVSTQVCISLISSLVKCLNFPLRLAISTKRCRTLTYVCTKSCNWGPREKRRNLCWNKSQGNERIGTASRSKDVTTRARRLREVRAVTNPIVWVKPGNAARGSGHSFVVSFFLPVHS